jgi:hypothetical protein
MAYHQGGTMNETSSDLAMLDSGPASGVWSGQGPDYSVTFELFVFDENGNRAGILRVNASLHLEDDNQLSSRFIIDFIDPAGNERLNVGSGTFTGTRVRVMPIQ